MTAIQRMDDLAVRQSRDHIEVYEFVTEKVLVSLTIGAAENLADDLLVLVMLMRDRGAENGSEDNPHESDGTAPEACSYCGDVWPCASGIPTCTGDPCTCANGIGCVNIPVDQW